MSLRDCIQTALDGGAIDKGSAVKMTNLYDDLAADAARLGLVDDVAITRTVGETIKADNLLRRHRELLTIKALDAIKVDVIKAQGVGKSVADAAVLLLENFGEAPFRSVVDIRKSIANIARAEMADVLNRFERTWTTGRTPNRADLDNLVREIHGHGTGDPRAKAMAEAWAGQAEYLRQRFNAAGGAIGKIDNYLPHSHDAAALWRAGKDAWQKVAMERFDRAKMLDPLTKQPFTDTGWQHQLERLYDRIVTGGDVNLEPSFAAGGQALASRHADHRFIQFKSADDWLAYDAEFGTGNPFVAMMDYVDTMARDIALMERLGPNPASMIRYLQDMIAKERATEAAAQGGKASGGINPLTKAPEKLLQDVYDDVSGAAYVVRGSMALANASSNLRNVVSSAKLGGAVLSSLTDLGNQSWARAFAGMSGSPLITPLTDTINAFRGSTRDELLRAGLATDRVLTVMQREASALGVTDGAGWSQWMADRTMTWSGLTGLTRALREGFGLRFLSDITEMRGLDWAAMKTEWPGYRAMFERYGLNEADWNAVRNVAPAEGGIIRPTDVARGGQREAAERLLGMIAQETEFATLQRVHRVYGGDNMLSINMTGERGTTAGELKRHMMSLKGYSLMVFKMQTIRAGQVAASTGSRAAGGAYFAGWFMTMTLLGGMVIQLKEMARGKDPRDITDPQFWGEAGFQGGGLGIMGDFIRSETNRVGGGVAETIMGPTLGSVSPILDLAITTPLQMMNDKEPNAGRQVRRFLSNNTPMLPFYLRLGYERAILDRLQEALDPKAKQAFRDQIRKSQNDYGQDWWWQPGDREPERGPDLGAALGGN